ncbi:hypothetical protein TNCV_337321 [Trichonephila clavipes]|nr:hypothetical protein TNCV_337321 [Trichonephila clavipes]
MESRCRLQALQPRAEVARWLQVARKWSPGYGISYKQVICHQKGWPRSSQNINTCTGSLIVILDSRERSSIRQILQVNF